MAGIQGAFRPFSESLALKVLSHEIPVHDIPEFFDVLGTGIPVVNVVSVLPDITGQKGLLP